MFLHHFIRNAAIALLVFATSTNAQAGRNGVPYVAPTGTVSIPVSSQSAGAISANNWTGFTSPAGTVFTLTSWGVTNGKYLQANDYHLIMAQTTASPRDVEVTSYVRDGTFFLRLFNGRAVYCRHNAEAGTSGFFEFGVVDGLPSNVAVNSAGANVGSYHALYQNTNMGGTVSGYDRNATSGATLTCRVSGLTISADFNGTTFASVKMAYAVAPGPVALWANNGIGFRDVTVNYLAMAPLTSMPSVSRFNPLDWGLKQAQTTGSITGGTNTLTLAASLGVAVGDGIIVAVGGENGAGARGTVGVGGNNPTLSYANAAAMNLDTGQPDTTLAWTRDNGQVFESFSGSWVRVTFYYTEFTAPRALLANVTGVSNGGLTLTLDTNATITATNASIYFNNYSAFNGILNPAAALPALSYVTMDIPAGTYAIAPPVGSSYTPPMAIASKTGWRVLGQGSASTILMSPAGATSAGISVSVSPSTEIANIGIVGNNGANGFGVGWAGNIQFTYPRAIDFETASDNSVAHDFACLNIFYSCISSGFSTNVTAYNFAITQQFAPTTRDIEPWYIEWSNSVGGGAWDGTFSSPSVITALEQFQSMGSQFKRITLTNGLVSCNGCGGGFLYEDITVTIQANVPGSTTQFSPVFDFNSNIGPPAGGGTVRRPTVIQQGYFDSSHNILIGLVVNPVNNNITVEGTYPAVNGKGCFQAPDWFSGTSAFNGVVIRNNGPSTTVSGIRFIGQADYVDGKSNIYNEGTSPVPAITSTNNIMDHIATGSGTITETGTQSNATWNAANPGHTACQ